MSSKSSTGDLFESDESDSDATVDLSNASHKVSSHLESSKVIVIDSESETESLTPHSNCIQDVQQTIAFEDSFSKMKRKVKQHTVSSSDSDNEAANKEKDNQQNATTSDSRPVCQYGLKCYRKNTDHLKDFWHPGVNYLFLAE